MRVFIPFSWLTWHVCLKTWFIRIWLGMVNCVVAHCYLELPSMTATESYCIDWQELGECFTLDMLAAFGMCSGQIDC
jgi:hypothetical protein